VDIPWPDERCILCHTEAQLTEEGSLSKEHLIPEAIGGVLTCQFLCRKCNSTLGSYESRLKEDPAVRLAAGNLRSQLPSLYESICEGQSFVAHSARGPARGVYKRGQFKVSASSQPDGSLILPTEDAGPALERMLSKGGFESSQIAEALRRFDDAPEDVPVTVAEGFDILKWRITGVDPALDGRLLMVRFEGGEELLQGAGIVLVKIAFEYLALHLGVVVLGSRFDPIREALQQNAPSRCPHRVEWRRGSGLAPFHGLVVEKKPSYVVVQARLFGELVFRVHFPHLIPGDGFIRYKYTHNLETGDERFEEA
jgi:hypothetical protein